MTITNKATITSTKGILAVLQHTPAKTHSKCRPCASEIYALSQNANSPSKICATLHEQMGSLVRRTVHGQIWRKRE
jgi:hypothetical protein